MMSSAHMAPNHVWDLLSSGLALIGLAIAAFLDAASSPIGLPGAEYIGMFGVVWLLFRNLDKREEIDREREQQELEIRRDDIDVRITERGLLESLKRAIESNTHQTAQLRRMLEEHNRTTQRQIDKNSEALQELSQRMK